jgi:threonine/homoserine/homoserine lactone efflux protein
VLALFLQALFIGVAIAAPVGPIGLLVIQRTLQRGVGLGLATGLGAAAADAVYGAIGAFGITGLIRWLQGVRVPLALGGAVFLLWLAWRSWHAPLAERAAEASDARAWLPAFVGTFVLTLSNPATIFSFIAVFGSLAARGPLGSPWPMVLGVLVGSALWWLLLCLTLGRMRALFDARWQRRINRVSALMLAAFALSFAIGPLLSLVPTLLKAAG